MKKQWKLYGAGAGLALLLAPAAVQGQAVAVTATLDNPVLNAGQSTTLRVVAQVVPAQRPVAERIFSWFLDVGHTNGAVAVAQYDAMLKTASDNDPQVSSTGTSQGLFRRGIFDTFINLAGAGVAAPVELMAIPVNAQAAGRTRFTVSAGTGQPLSDFLVSQQVDPDPLTGGDYSAAFADLEVTQACALQLGIQRLSGPGPQRYQLSFTPCAGFNHTVQSTGALLIGGSVWTPLPGAPHNAGLVTVTNPPTPRFFRVMAVPQ